MKRRAGHAAASSAATRSPHLADALAGLSIAGLLLPEAVAYSGLANLPPQAGVIGLFAGLLCYALIGNNRFAIVTSTSSSAAVLAAATLSLAGGDIERRLALASILVVGCGVAFAVCGALRLGAMSNLIARPVLRGFAFGLALTIVLKQWPHLSGSQAHGGGFFASLCDLVRDGHEAQPYALATGVAALLALFALTRVRHVPAAFVVIIAGIAASPWLQAHGVAPIGTIDLALSAPTFALPADAQWLSLCELALALMFILYAESYGSIRSLALKHDDPVWPNRDLLALGAANIVSGMLHGTPVGAGYSATSANEAAGAQTRIAGLCAAGVVLVLLALFLPWIARIPTPVLAAVVIHAVSHALSPRQFAPYFRWRRDRLVALTAVAFVLAFGVLDGLLAAIAFSVAMLLRSLGNPRLSELGRVGAHDFVSRTRYAQAAAMPGLLILRPEEPLFFANAEPLLALARQRLLEARDVTCVVLSLEESPDLDSTTIESLAEFAAWLQERAIGLRLARLKEDSREALLSARIAALPADALEYASVDDAVNRTPAGVGDGAQA